MLDSLSIKNFRLFRDLKVESLSRVNLIAGKNNTGKTALLEAVYLLFSGAGGFFDFPGAFRGSQQTISAQRTAGKRGNNFINFWMWLPYQKEPANLIEIEAANERRYAVKLDQQLARGRFTELIFHYLKNGQEVGAAHMSKGAGG